MDESCMMSSLVFYFCQTSPSCAAQLYETDFPDPIHLGSCENLGLDRIIGSEIRDKCVGVLSFILS